MAESVSEIIERILKKTVTKMKPEAIRKHELVYQSPTETLEPIYFWIVDMMNNFFGGKTEKLIDNFSSSVGGGHFGELSQKKSILQKNVTETMGTINTVLRSMINLIYDLKDFEIRLEHYDDSNSKDPEKRGAGLLALKQVWLDSVDMKRGNGAIHMMAQNLNFVTLRDAFMKVNSIKEVKEVDLNERVKRILEPRISEFFKWKETSERELRARFNIEKNYLKSQVNMLKLYSRWVKPYLIAATKLEGEEYDKDPDLVNAFNTLKLQLTLMGKSKLDIEDAIITKQIPKAMKKPGKDFYSVVVVDFTFRGIPNKVGQHYAFGGRVKAMFKAYAMTSDELKVFDEEMKKSDLSDVLALIDGATNESIDELRKDIEHFTGEMKDKKTDKESGSDTNPFSALFSPFFGSGEKKKKEEKKITLKDLKKDSYSDSVLRALAAYNSSNTCFTIYDVYKKAHGMASHDNPFEV
jgi:hypothetical protein